MNSVAPGTTKHLFLSLSDVFVLLVWLVGCIFARLVVCLMSRTEHEKLSGHRRNT